MISEQIQEKGVVLPEALIVVEDYDEEVSSKKHVLRVHQNISVVYCFEKEVPVEKLKSVCRLKQLMKEIIICWRNIY